MRTIPLSKGYVAMIDDEDYERVSRFKWHVEITKGGKIYAQTTYVRNRYITQVRLHRFIMGCTEGDGLVVDHKNGDGLDNQKANLRRCTQSQNIMNAKGKRGGTSRYKGVSWHTKTGRWRAVIRHGGKTLDIGYAECEIEAAIMYNVAAQWFFGEYAYLNPV